MPERWTIEHFEPQQATRFQWHAAALGVRPLELIEVKRLRVNRVGGSPAEREPFSLIFRDHSANALPQSTYRLDHDQLGTMEIFLVPIGLDEQGMRYQAVFT
ncbi:MAG: hypothetical protein U1A77_13960 [Pirellulales bacterium]